MWVRVSGFRLRVWASEKFDGIEGLGLLCCEKSGCIGRTQNKQKRSSDNFEEYVKPHMSHILNS